MHDAAPPRTRGGASGDRNQRAQEETGRHTGLVTSPARSSTHSCNMHAHSRMACSSRLSALPRVTPGARLQRRARSVAPRHRPHAAWTDEFTSLDDRKDAPPLPLPPLSSPRRVVLVRKHERFTGAACVPPAERASARAQVRHGQSTWNAEGRIQGSSDLSELTEKARAGAMRRAHAGDADTCSPRAS